MEYTPAVTFSPANVYPNCAASGVSPTFTANNTNPADIVPNITSPDAFTPVQKEDVNIFTTQYFELINERMEQDRERQRKKEDNSGFVKAANTGSGTGATDEEVAQGIGNTDGYVGNTKDWNEMSRITWVKTSVFM